MGASNPGEIVQDEFGAALFLKLVNITAMSAELCRWILQWVEIDIYSHRFRKKKWLQRNVNMLYVSLKL